MKLNIKTNGMLTIEQYNKHYEDILAEAKTESDQLYSTLRSNMVDPGSQDYAVNKSHIAYAIEEAKFNRARKNAKKKAHDKYEELVVSKENTMLRQARDKALEEIRQSLYNYGYGMSYLHRVAEPILLDLYRAYMLDKSTGFQMPIEMKLEGHMNAVLNNMDLNILPENFFTKASAYTDRGRQNAYYAPVRREIDSQFVCKTDGAYRYSVACKMARMQFFSDVNHGRMAQYTPKTDVSYSKALSQLEKSPVYNHTTVRRKGKNPYARLLSLHELNSMLQYQNIAKTGRVDTIIPEDIQSMTDMYEAYIDYGFEKGDISRQRLLSVMPAAIKMADASKIRVAVMADSIDTLTRARDYESRNSFMFD